MAQFAVYPLDMNIYGERYEVGFVTSVCTYPEYTVWSHEEAYEKESYEDAR